MANNAFIYILLIVSLLLSSCASSVLVGRKINSSTKNYDHINKVMKKKKAGIIVLNETSSIDSTMHRTIEVEQLLYIDSVSDSLFYKVYEYSTISGKHLSEIYKIGTIKSDKDFFPNFSHLLVLTPVVASVIEANRIKDDPYAVYAIGYIFVAGAVSSLVLSFIVGLSNTYKKKKSPTWSINSYKYYTVEY